MKLKPWRLIFLAALVAVGCGGSTRTSQSVPVSTLEKASVAFNGNPSPSTIKAKLDEALRLYNMPISDENYSRAASALIVLRRENGTDEMKILDHMIRSHVPGTRVTFPDAAGLSSAALRLGDR